VFLCHEMGKCEVWWYVFLCHEMGKYEVWWFVFLCHEMGKHLVKLIQPKLDAIIVLWNYAFNFKTVWENLNFYSIRDLSRRSRDVFFGTGMPVVNSPGVFLVADYRRFIWLHGLNCRLRTYAVSCHAWWDSE